MFAETPCAAAPLINGLVLEYGRSAAISAFTNAVVAIDVSLSPGVGVGAFGSPVNTGEAIGARLVSVG